MSDWQKLGDDNRNLEDGISCEKCKDTGEIEVRVGHTDKGYFYVKDTCPACCEHGDLDSHRICLSCGKELNDWGDLADRIRDEVEDR